MRLAMGDPLLVNNTARVYLDGVERNNVIMADEENRVIERHRTDEKGDVILDATRENILTETLRGDVRIELVPR